MIGLVRLPNSECNNLVWETNNETLGLPLCDAVSWLLMNCENCETANAISGQVAIAAEKSDLTFCWYRVYDISVKSSLSETAKISRIDICIEDNQLVLILRVRLLQIFMMYAFARAIRLFLSGRRSYEALRTILAPFFSQLLAFLRARQLFLEPHRAGSFWMQTRYRPYRKNR